MAARVDVRGRVRLAVLVFAASLSSAWSQSSPHVADTGPARALEAPVDPRPIDQKFWWSDAWFDRGHLETPQNFDVIRRELSYRNPADGTDVPAILFKPKGEDRYPAVLFAHGRRGLDPLIERLAIRIAARGFTVLAPNLFAARFIETMPIEHDRMTESDLGAGLEALLARPEVSTAKACVVSHTRGGYYSLRMAVTHKAQEARLACYVSYYPHWQDPGLAEPHQVYRHAPEAERLAIPTLVFIGEYEQYQRRRSIESATKAMRQAGRDVRLIIYPGVGRGFDFRSGEVRTFADDLAAKDAAERTARFLRKALAPPSNN